MMRRTEAGRSAKAIYDDRRKKWKRRNRKVFLLAVAPIWLLAIAVFIAARPTSPWDFIAGMSFGTAVVFTMMLGELAPSHIRNWELGAMGEQSTERQLRRLTRGGWHVVHDRAGKFDRPTPRDEEPGPVALRRASASGRPTALGRAGGGPVVRLRRRTGDASRRDVHARLRSPGVARVA
jgi:hypothetical protein